MRDMKDYEDFPPLPALKKVLHSCPQAALLFISLHKLIPKARRITVKRKDVKHFFLISPTLFRNHLLSLSRIDALSFEESTENFIINFSASYESKI